MANLFKYGHTQFLQGAVKGTDGVPVATPEFQIVVSDYTPAEGTNAAVAGSITVEFGGSTAWVDAGFNAPTDVGITFL